MASGRGLFDVRVFPGHMADSLCYTPRALLHVDLTAPLLTETAYPERIDPMTSTKITRAAATVAHITTAVAALSDPALVRGWLDAAATQYRGEHARTALYAVVLALVSPRPINVLFIGPPGTGKTSMATAVARAFALRFLGRTLNPWTADAELLGAVDLKALQAGVLARASSPTVPTLTDAELVLLDEFPRAAPGIRAMVMSSLSDRVTPTGDVVPAHVIVAGANTRLTSEEDKATADRFALRVEVPRLMSAPDLEHVITREVSVDGATATAAPVPALSSVVLARMRQAADAVTMPGDIAKALTRLALLLRQPPKDGVSYPDVSERRWVLATRLLQANAALHERTSIAWEDLTTVLPLVLDDGAETRANVRTAVSSSIPKWVAALADLESTIAQATARARRVGEGKALDGDGDAHAKANATLDDLIDTVKPFGADVVRRATERVEAARDAIEDAYIAGVEAAKAARAADRKSR